MNTPSLRTGARVIVPAPFTVSKCPQLEGHGTLLAESTHLPNLWKVRFDGERHTRWRIVHGGPFQTDFDRILAALTLHYRATIDPALLSDSRFPVDPGQGDFIRK